MTANPLQQSLAEALAPDGEYEIPQDLDAAMPPEDPEIEPPWRVLNDRMLSWALRKMGDAQREVRDIEGQVQTLYDEELARLNDWRERALHTSNLNDLRRTAAFMEAHATLYLARLRREDPDRHTVSVPWGKVSHRRSQSVQVDDAEALIAWARQNGFEEFLKITPSPADIKKALPANDDDILQPIIGNARLPGVRVEIRDNFTVTAT